MGRSAPHGSFSWKHRPPQGKGEAEPIEARQAEASLGGCRVAKLSQPRSISCLTDLCYGVAAIIPSFMAMRNQV
jgi:hypothetical protein